MIDFIKPHAQERSGCPRSSDARLAPPVRKTLLLPAALLLGLLCPAHAQTTWSEPGNGNWKDGGNWSAGAPAGGINVNINNAGSKVVTVEDVTPVGNLSIGILNVYGFGTATNELHLFNSSQWLQASGVVQIDSAGATGLGKLVNSGGLLRSASNIRVGYAAGGRGELEMSSGQIEAASINLGSHNIGTHGTMTMSGGSVLLSDALRVGVFTYGAGIANITGGTISTAAVYVGGTTTATIGSHGTLNVSGEAVVDTGDVYVRVANVSSGDLGSASFIVRDGGTLQFSKAAPLISTSAGKVTFKIKDAVVGYRGVNNADINYSFLMTQATFEGQNAFRLNNSNNASVASYSFASNLGAANYARLELTGAAARWRSTALTIGTGGELSVFDAGQATIAAGSTTSTGAISVSDSRLKWEGTLALQGGYESAAAENLFTQDVTVGAAGYFAGSAGSSFEFEGNLVNQSLDTASFNLLSSTVAFTSGGNHLFNITSSASLEQGIDGLRADNQAIGSLAIEVGNQLTLVGTVGVNALYIGLLDLSGWDTSPEALLLTLQSALDLSSGINLYYDYTLLGNSYLSGETYDLWGGGELRAVPEPSTLALVGGAFLAATVAGRKRIAKAV